MDNVIAIRTVILRDGDTWIAQCVDYDIGAQANDVKTLRSRLTAVIKAEFHESMAKSGEPFKGIPCSPAHFKDMWDGCGDPLTSVDGRTSTSDGHELKFEYALCA